MNTSSKLWTSLAALLLALPMQTHVATAAQAGTSVPGVAGESSSGEFPGGGSSGLNSYVGKHFFAQKANQDGGVIGPLAGDEFEVHVQLGKEKAARNPGFFSSDGNAFTLSSANGASLPGGFVISPRPCPNATTTKTEIQTSTSTDTITTRTQIAVLGDSPASPSLSFLQGQPSPMPAGVNGLSDITGTDHPVEQIPDTASGGSAEHDEPPKATADKSTSGEAAVAATNGQEFSGASAAGPQSNSLTETNSGNRGADKPSSNTEIVAPANGSSVPPMPEFPVSFPLAGIERSPATANGTLKKAELTPKVSRPPKVGESQMGIGRPLVDGRITDLSGLTPGRTELLDDLSIFASVKFQYQKRLKFFDLRRK